jgi:flagellar hook-length control protein FliK
MQAVFLTATAPATPGGKPPAETPRGGAAFDRVLKDEGEAGTTEEEAGLVVDLAEAVVDPDLPDPELPEGALVRELPTLVLPDLPVAESVTAVVWPTAFGMAQGALVADGLMPDAPAVPQGVAAAPAPVVPDEAPPVAPTGAPAAGPASLPAPPQTAQLVASQQTVSPALVPPALPLPPLEQPVQAQPPQLSPDRITVPTLPATVTPLVSPKGQQREAVVPGFWTLRTRELPTEGTTSSTQAPSAVAPAALSPPSPPALPILPPPSVTEVATDLLLLPPEPEMQLASPGTVATAQPGVQLQAAPGLPPTLAADLSALIARRPDGPVELTLSPEELGRLRISLTQEGDGLVVTVQVERADTLDLLRRNADVLLQEIRAAGFAGGSFSFSGWGGGASGGAGPQSFTARSEPPPPPAPPPAMAGTGLDLRL